MKILIIEDETELSDVVRQSLEQEDFRVETAETYASALDKIISFDYDCILRDIMLHSNGRVEMGDKYFSISNTGNSVPLDPQKMFLRFHKGSSERNSTGLGLAIVKGITDLYGFRIGYIYDGMHRIRVSL